MSRAFEVLLDVAEDVGVVGERREDVDEAEQLEVLNPGFDMFVETLSLHHDIRNTEERSLAPISAIRRARSVTSLSSGSAMAHGTARA